MPFLQAHSWRNRLLTEYDSDMARRLAALVRRRATAANPELIQLIRAMMDPPSSHMVMLNRNDVTTPQSREIDAIFKAKVFSSGL